MQCCAFNEENKNVDFPPDIWPMPSLKYLPKDIKREGGAH